MHAIKFLTLNCWGLKYISRKREERLKAIADRLSRGEHDIIALQEVWVEADWNELDRMCKPLYPFRRMFRSGVVAGPGLCLILKYPIESTSLYRFPVNGRPSAFYRGDWYVGKGVAVTIIDLETPDSYKLAVLNSHMHAPYANEGDAAYLTHRICQAWDMAKLHRLLRKAGYAVIQVGDLNSEPGSLPYRIITEEGRLVDSWDYLNNESFTHGEILRMSPHDQIVKGGITCNSKLNTWSVDKKLEEAKRLDFVLVDISKLKPIHAKVEFTETLPPPLACSYSDHFGYSIELALIGLVVTKHTPTIITELYDDIVSNIETYLERTIPFQMNWRFWHFLFSFVTVILIHVAIFFALEARSWSSILLCFGSTTVAVTGVVNGLIAFISIRSEKHDIEEVKMEVNDAKIAKGSKIVIIEKEDLTS